LALRVCKSPLKWFRPGTKTFVIDPEMAWYIAKAGVYEGKVSLSGHRVFYIREVDPRPAPLKDTHFRDGLPVLRYEKGVDKETVFLWDRIFANARRAAASSV